MWVADVLELESDVPCSDGTIFRRSEDGGSFSGLEDAHGSMMLIRTAGSEVKV